jgi:hypothetical protein
MVLQPVGNAGFRHRLVAPVPAVDLVAHLQRIAAVGEDRGFFGQHHSRAGRALEAGQPSQPLRIGADIFTHMLVGERHDKSIQPLRLELGPEGLQTILVSGHVSASPFQLPVIASGAKQSRSGAQAGWIASSLRSSQ